MSIEIIPRWNTNGTAHLTLIAEYPESDKDLQLVLELSNETASRKIFSRTYIAKKKIIGEIPNVKMATPDDDTVYRFSAVLREKEQEESAPEEPAPVLDSLHMSIIGTKQCFEYPLYHFTIKRLYDIFTEKQWVRLEASVPLVPLPEYKIIRIDAPALQYVVSGQPVKYTGPLIFRKQTAFSSPACFDLAEFSSATKADSPSLIFTACCYIKKRGRQSPVEMVLFYFDSRYWHW